MNLPSGFDGRLWRYVERGVAHPMHRHAELEFNFVVRGRARYLLGDRRYDIGRHALIWLFPGQEHILVDRARDLEMWIAVFRPALVKRTARGAVARTLRAANPPGYFCRSLSEAAARSLGALCASVAAAEEDAVRCNLGLGYALLEAWTAFGAAREGAGGLDVHPAVERAAWILRDRSDLPDLEGLAAEAGLSPSRLSRIFKEQMGVPLAAFRNRCRLDRFLALYGEGRRTTMLAAALDAGFGSYPQFHRIFRRMMGVSPADYRRGRTT
ncbi:MAG: AraC family transcriptional regulator [Planctomycetes bacterium]|nr:AraC family transcriptional regulator [Planctomycetota bacterium]